MSDTPVLGTLRTDPPDLPAPEGDAQREAASTAPRHSRRLSDKILIAFHHACDQADYDIAAQLLHVLESLVTRRPLNPETNRRRSMESLVAAHERLWLLRHQRDRAN
jgi:hypothetical protein